MQSHDNTPHDVPLKQCTWCGENFPATREYFTRDRGNKDGLRSWCKPCYRHKQRQWREKDPERYKRYERENYARNRETIIQSVAAWQKSARGKKLMRLTRLRNADKKRIQDRKYYAKNRDRIIERALQWQSNNRKKRRVIRQRRAARIENLPDNFTEDDWQFALNHFNGCCAACGRPPGLFHCLAADHWVPLASNACPGTIPTNIVPLCHGDRGCNNAKQNRDPIEWLESTFGERQAQKVLERIHEFFSVARC